MRPLLVIVAPLLALGACGGGSEPSVEISTFAFSPERIAVDAGAEVTWENRDDITHTVTSGIAQEQGVPGQTENEAARPDGLFDQELTGVGESFTFRFDEVGTFTYFCAIHPGMEGSVEVR